MRLQVYSDVHLEHGPFQPPTLAADAVVLAGDIAEGVAGLTWAREMFDLPVIYVAGNHEFYGQRLPEILEHLTQEATRLGIHFLENNEVVINGVRFLGATLWTDLEVRGHLRPDGPNGDEARVAAYEGKRLMNDYRQIRYGAKRRNGRDRLQPADTLAMHNVSRAWLSSALSTPFAGRTVVVTHHAPHLQSAPSLSLANRYIPFYVSHLADLVRAPVDLWIHGHYHTSRDYKVGDTRVVSNPRGRSDSHNPRFSPDLLLQI